MVAVSGLALLTACGGGIRVVALDDEGGLLELNGDDGPAHEAAERHMRQHCPGGEYRVVFDGESTVPVDEGHGPSASESARRMALPSDLPGAIEPAGTEPAGGSSIDDSGQLHVGSAADGARERRVSYQRRRRLEYECEEAEDEDDIAEEDLSDDDVVAAPPPEPPSIEPPASDDPPPGDDPPPTAPP